MSVDVMPYAVICVDNNVTSKCGGTIHTPVHLHICCLFSLKLTHSMHISKFFTTLSETGTKYGSSCT